MQFNLVALSYPHQCRQQWLYLSLSVIIDLLAYHKCYLCWCLRYVVIRLEHGQVTEVCFSVEIVTSVGVDFEIEL